jgi:hypothetical protein
VLLEKGKPCLGYTFGFVFVKVVPVCILMKGATTTTVLNFLFRERSSGKSIIPVLQPETNGR